MTGALAAACFVKAFGVTFLGHWRGHTPVQRVHEVGWEMRIGMMLAAVTCFLLGNFPRWLSAGWMSSRNVWWAAISELLRANSAGRGSPPLRPKGLILGLQCLHCHTGRRAGSLVHPSCEERDGPAVSDLGLRLCENKCSDAVYRHFVFHADPAHIRVYFPDREESHALEPVRHSAYPEKLQYRLRVRDRFQFWIYQPINEVAYFIARKVGMLQQGRIQVYLIYSFVTIIVLLVFL